MAMNGPRPTGNSWPTILPPGLPGPRHGARRNSAGGPKSAFPPQLKESGKAMSDAVADFGHGGYAVVVNEDNQYSIWQADLEPPAGWRAEGFSGERWACLDHIAAAWTEMRPAAPAPERPPAPLLPELILRQAGQRPEAPAVLAPTGQLGYRELESSARRIAGSLARLGAGPESVVALLVSPGPDLVAAVLGAWLAGACYLPLDPFAPPRRQRQVLEAAGARVLLTDGAFADRARELAPDYAHEVGQLIADGDPQTPGHAVHPRQAAYLIFTSGSTGAPKGVVVEHAGIANRVAWGIRALELTERDRILQKTPLTFDAAGWEIFAPLVCGAPVVYGRPDAGRDPGELAASIRETGATVVQAVPTMLRLLAAEPEFASCESLRLICSAGEPLHAELCQRLIARTSAEIWNTYGPTECSIDVLAQRFDPAQLRGPVPIGRPIDNARYVLLPTGSEGEGEPLHELCLCGPGVGRGYFGDAARTAQAFLPDPYGPPGSRMYRTGDLVRLRADGALDFVGRADSQVKIHGVRIEPAEIEAVLEAHPEVVEAAVRAVPGPDGGGPRLAAWVAVRRPGLATTLPEYLRELLPAALVPALIGEIDALPRTGSGKTDRARLPEPDWSAAPGDDTREQEPETAEERIVLSVWRQLLGARRPARDDDFFRLGGDSLLLTRLAAKLTEASGLEVGLGELFRAPTARQQARLLAEASKALPIDPLPAGSRLRLSHAQERFWVLDRMNPRSRQYLLPILIWLPSEIAADTVEEAVARLVERHEVLRTRFAMDVYGLAAVVEPGDRAVAALRREDTTPEEVGGILAELLETGFDLASAPLYRAGLIRDGGPEQLLVLVCHHIVGDGWSSRILERELTEIVAALGSGREPELAPLPLRYVDAVAWQRARAGEDELAEQLAYWRETLAGLPALALPGKRDPGRRRGVDGAGVLVDLPAPAIEALLALGRRSRTTPYVVLLTLWTVALARIAGDWDFGVGSPHAGRVRPELHDLVGLFVNTVVLRSRLTADLSFAEAVVRVEGVCREGFARYAVPFEAVVDAVAPERDMSAPPLFQTLFALSGDGLVGQAPRERDLELLAQGWKSARTDLALTLWPQADGGYGGALEYATDVYDESVAKDLAEQLRALAERFARDPAEAIGAGLPEPAPDRPTCLDTVLGFVHELLPTPDDGAEAGPDDDFMSLGGTSMLAARLLWNVQSAYGVEVSMRVFFDQPTAAELARRVEELLSDNG